MPGGWQALARRLPPTLVALVVVHAALLPQLRVFDVAADVLLAFAVAAGVVGGAERGAWVGFATGLMADSFLQTPFGLSALAYGLVGCAAGTFSAPVLVAGRWFAALATLLASAAGVALYVAVGVGVGQDHLVSGRLWLIVAVVAVLNAALSPALVPLARWALAPTDAPLPKAARR